MTNPTLVIDIGSSKICAIIGKSKDDGTSFVAGYGLSKSNAVKKGMITNIDQASKDIKEVVEKAKSDAKAVVSSAVVSVAGTYTRTFRSTAILTFGGKELTLKEIKQTISTALKNANIPLEEEVLHVFPYQFKVDGVDGIEDPYGMKAKQLEVMVSIVVAKKSLLENLRKAVRLAGLTIDSMILDSYASALSVLTEDEKAFGTAVVDMGAESVDLLITQNSSIAYADSIPVGSKHITSDLSIGLHTPLEVSDKLKLKYKDIKNSGYANIALPVMGDTDKQEKHSLEFIDKIVSARIKETLNLLAKSIDKSGLAMQIQGGVVLTGGMSKMFGLVDYAKKVFEWYPVRLGYPKDIEGLPSELKEPEYSTAVGLLLYKNGEFIEYELDSKDVLKHHKKDSKKESLIDLNITNEIPKKSRESSKRKKKKIVMPIPDKEVKTRIDDGNNISFDELIGKPPKKSSNESLFKKISKFTKKLF